MKLLIALLLIGGHLTTYAAVKSHAINKPNIVVFYVDDLGWQDTQLNDIDEPTPWETPNILSLAQRGMNFTQAYSPAPTCSPSRAGLLSGQHPAKLQLTHVLGASIPNAGTGRRLLPPYINDHLQANTLTIAEALRANGYKTGHSGKWHLGQYPNVGPKSEGFDFSFGGRGVHRNRQDRSTGFASTSEDDEYRLSDEKYFPFSDKHPNGISYPYDLVTENALNFIKTSKEEPFFLYLAHWMVHYPTITKNRALLEYYTDKLGIEFPKDKSDITTPGQTNPYYGAMVTTVDWSLGRLVSLLETTDDPRNPGKKLIDTTYIFLSSDNGGTENRMTELITDNAPLDLGKKHSKEGGIRVPMVVSGPSVASGTEFHGLINQLDYFPTILSLTQTDISNQDEAKLSGSDFSKVLTKEHEIVYEKDGSQRESLFWHFPHNQDSDMQSAIRQGDYKLYKNYVDNSYHLYRLYKDGKRADLEEMHDLASVPEYGPVVNKLAKDLHSFLVSNNATEPFFNPNYTDQLIGKEQAPQIVLNSFDPDNRQIQVSLNAAKNGATQAYVLGQIKKNRMTEDRVGKEFISYKKLKASISEDGYAVSGELPNEFTDYVVVVVDENRFLVASDVFSINTQTSK